jgi:sulfur carrier protein
MKIIVIVNGNEKEFKKSITLQELLNELSLDGKVMAAAVNMDIIKQNIWDKHILVDGDKLELLDFVGGG